MQERSSGLFLPFLDSCLPERAADATSQETTSPQVCPPPVREDAAASHLGGAWGVPLPRK